MSDKEKKRGDKGIFSSSFNNTSALKQATKRSISHVFVLESSFPGLVCAFHFDPGLEKRIK